MQTWIERVCVFVLGWLVGGVYTDLRGYLATVSEALAKIAGTMG